ncbi:MAG: response regulator transcription factor [Pirellulaceae bacterium]|nr:response regulator transcription factor [Pirellulaceae bacterium]
MPRPKILIVEDDRAIADVLIYNLQALEYEVSHASNGPEGLELAQRNLPDVVILDVMLPGIDGLEVCRRLKSAPEIQLTKILMLTAKGEEGDQLVGFNVGADDYVVKPFSVRILMERIKALLRRVGQDEPIGDEGVIICGPIKIDRLKHRVQVNGEAVELTASEFRLLDSLISQPGRVFDRQELIELALGSDSLVLERTVDVHVRSIRKKLGALAECIETVRGVGYRFYEPDRQA